MDLAEGKNAHVRAMPSQCVAPCSIHGTPPRLNRLLPAPPADHLPIGALDEPHAGADCLCLAADGKSSIH
eukprot:1401781-Pyramimonas_sp.AAC.1